MALCLILAKMGTLDWGLMQPADGAFSEGEKTLDFPADDWGLLCRPDIQRKGQQTIRKPWGLQSKVLLIKVFPLHNKRASFYFYLFIFLNQAQLHGVHFCVACPDVWFSSRGDNPTCSFSEIRSVASTPSLLRSRQQCNTHGTSMLCAHFNWRISSANLTERSAHWTWQLYSQLGRRGTLGFLTHASPQKTTSFFLPQVNPNSNSTSQPVVANWN